MAPPDVAENLFRDVVFFVDDSVAAENRPSVRSICGATAMVANAVSLQLTQDMIHRGGTLCPPAPPLNESAADNIHSSKVHPRFDLDQITHIISETWEIPERQLIEEHPRREEIFTVTVCVLPYKEDLAHQVSPGSPVSSRNGILGAVFSTYKSVYHSPLVSQL
jgi:hypothetical protein